MVLKYLQQDEKKTTRELWELIFREDSKAFLDYYYTYKTAGNQIMVLEGEEGYRAMLQLNPYQLQVNEKSFKAHYIIGVATHPDFRHRGYMSRLLRRMFMDMYEKKEPFTYLMPASAAIYKPFDFQFIYEQNQGMAAGSKEAGPMFPCTGLTEDGISELVEFSNAHLHTAYQVYTVRDKGYYQTLLHELRSEDGDIVIIRKREQIIGYFFYAQDAERIEVREPVMVEEHQLLLGAVIRAYFKDSPKQLNCSGFEEGAAGGFIQVKKTPVIMARIIHLHQFMKLIKSNQEASFLVQIEDQFIPGNNGLFQIRTGAGGSVLKRVTAGEPEVKLDIRTLTGLLFGYLKAEDILSTDMLKRTAGIQVLNKVFINEIV